VLVRAPPPSGPSISLTLMPAPPGRAAPLPLVLAVPAAAAVATLAPGGVLQPASLNVLAAAAVDDVDVAGSVCGR
jgi:hypothetical protein